VSKIVIPSVLHQIAQSVQIKLEERRRLVPIEALREKVSAARQPHPFSKAFRTPRIHTIAEVKFKSPALGILEESDLHSAVKIAKEYVRGGTTAISVLTEEDYFHGSSSYLRAIRDAEPNAFLLMKDFILDEYQILEGLLNGADAILLIMALLGKEEVQRLKSIAEKLGLSILIEVHDETELNDALGFELSNSLIGINNRNLKTLEVDITTSFKLIQKINIGSFPQTRFISESGIKTPGEIRALHQAGFSGFLIGSTLMTSGNPGDALASLIKEASK